MIIEIILILFLRRERCTTWGYGALSKPVDKIRSLSAIQLFLMPGIILFGKNVSVSFRRRVSRAFSAVVGHVPRARGLLNTGQPRECLVTINVVRTRE